MKLVTPEQFMKDLNWSIEDLRKAKDMLVNWNKRDNNYYINVSPLSKKVDKAEREHLRNSIQYWEERLSHEIKCIRNS